MTQIPLTTWIEVLDKYLTEAERSVRDNDFPARKEIREKLHAFIKSTPQKYEFLDNLVRETLHELNEIDLDAATANIKKAASEIENQRAVISLATEKAQAGASEIRLEQLTENLDTAKMALGQLKETGTMLADENLTFKEKIMALKERFDELKDNTTN